MKGTLASSHSLFVKGTGTSPHASTKTEEILLADCWTRTRKIYPAPSRVKGNMAGQISSDTTTTPDRSDRGSWLCRMISARRATSALVTMRRSPGEKRTLPSRGPEEEVLWSTMSLRHRPSGP